MKRKRPILYEVFGTGGIGRGEARAASAQPARGRAPGAGRPAGSAKPPGTLRGAREPLIPGDVRALQELRVSYELVAVLALVLVVLGATLYYFAYVRGKASGNLGSLSALERVEPGGRRGAGAPPPASQPARYHSVSVIALPASKLEQAFGICDFLEARGFTDVAVIQVRDQIQVCVGRAANKKDLESTLADVRGLVFRGSRSFAGASVTTVDLGSGSG